MQKTVLITGGSQGIGQACVKAFAEAGYRVVIHYYRSEAQAQALCQSLRQSGCDALCVQADIQDPQQVQHAAKQALEFLGHIDVLICNAGIAQQKLFCDITDEDWRTMIDTNLSGIFYTIRAVLPDMIRQHHGRIITISSVWGVHGASCEVHYSAAKAGVIGLTQALAKEVGPSGITVNCIAPGVIDTRMCQGFDAEAMAVLQEETPMGRIGKPEDVAQAALLLSASDFITGQVLGVDGGFGD